MKNILIFLLLILSSCQTPEEAVPESSHYLPLSSRTFNQYAVTRTSYFLGEKPYVFSASMRISTGMPFEMTGGRTSYPVAYAVQLPNGQWQNDSIHVVWEESGRILEKESAATLVKLQRPLVEKMSWNVNAFNTLAPQMCNLESVDQPRMIANNHFPKTLTVVVQDDSTLLTRKKYIEVYAGNTGLVLREKLYLKYCHSEDCLGKGIIDYGWKEVIVFQNSGKL